MKFEYFFRTRSFFVLAISLFSGYSMAATYYWEKGDPNTTEITGTFLMYPFADSVPLQCGWGYFCNDDIQLCNLDYGKLNPELSGKDSTLVSVGTDVSMGSGKMLVSKIDKSLGGSCKIPPSCADRPDIALGKKSDLTFSYITSANGVSTAVYGSVTSQGITYPLKYTTDDKGDSAYYSSVSGCYYYLNDLSEDVFLKSLDVADSDFMENLKKIIDSGSDKSDGSGGSTSGGSSGGSTSGGSSGGSTSGGSSGGSTSGGSSGGSTSGGSSGGSTSGGSSGGSTSGGSSGGSTSGGSSGGSTSGDDDGWLGDILGWLQRIWSSVNDLNSVFSFSQTDVNNALNTFDDQLKDIVNSDDEDSTDDYDSLISGFIDKLPKEWLFIDFDKLFFPSQQTGAQPIEVNFSFSLPVIGVVHFSIDTTDFSSAYDLLLRPVLEYFIYVLTIFRLYFVYRRALMRHAEV
ncbi:hypothetical protein KJE01_13025 [Escherichia marmotae]|uniref:hypothetical protein n=1 Tax=Escherichia TaxID=561 RepID=UPI001BC8627C|nr:MULTISPECIES: hypothetical protein [Escherichia]EIN7427617.1 hypothetical protein [Escherichia coli]EIT3956948.1 hypothetical protein [Escherichia coli]EJN0013742.1 hypothetical protein [Escherichia coli]EJV3499360.1 hypothetical protein [Escherichia coli]EJZ1088830.1 hypothetical protein [Escherichia coli]